MVSAMLCVLHASPQCFGFLFLLWVSGWRGALLCWVYWIESRVRPRLQRLQLKQHTLVKRFEQTHVTPATPAQTIPTENCMRKRCEGFYYFILTKLNKKENLTLLGEDTY